MTDPSIYISSIGDMVGLANKCEYLEKENASPCAEIDTHRSILKAYSGPAAEQKVEDARQMQMAEIVAPADEAAGSEAEAGQEQAPSIARGKGRKRRVSLAKKIENLPVRKTTYIVQDIV